MNVLDALKNPEQPLPVASLPISQLGDVDIFPITLLEREDFNKDFSKLAEGEIGEVEFYKKWFARALLGENKKFTKAQWKVFSERATFQTEKDILNAIRDFPFDQVKKP